MHSSAFGNGVEVTQMCGFTAGSLQFLTSPVALVSKMFTVWLKLCSVPNVPLPPRKVDSNDTSGGLKNDSRGNAESSLLLLKCLLEEVISLSIVKRREREKSVKS